MKVFISWSGGRSRAVAGLLRSWLPDVINYIEPWISSEDIEKGARWSADLMHQLSETHVGIICLTPENISAPWIHFEAGALSKALDRSRLCTYLLQLRPSDLEGPLVQFQATEATEEDTLGLLRTLNSGLGEHARTDDQLLRSFAKWWPELQKGLAAIPRDFKTKPLRSDRELLEEMLDLLRSQTKRSTGRKSRMPWIGDPSALLEGEDLEAFTENFMRECNIINEDPTAWDVDIRGKATDSALDGIWTYRWNGTTADDDKWRYGVANLIHRGEFLVAVCSEEGSPFGPYLLVSRKTSDRNFVGPYLSLREPRDSGPWGGVVLDGSRIDGKWGWGRWDFRRKLG